MGSMSEFSSESDPYHDSDNSDIDPDYEVEEDITKKTKFKALFNNNVAISEDHSVQGNFINY